jgi:hypothetical protein
MSNKNNNNNNTIDDDDDDDSSSDSGDYMYANICHNDPQIDQIIKAINTGDIQFLSRNKRLISHLYEINNSNNAKCFCGCLQTYSILTCLMHVPAYKLSGDDDALRQEQALYERSINYLLDNGIICPDMIFSYHDGSEKRECILSQLLSNYAGWEVQRKMIRKYLSKTSGQIIRDFRDSRGATMLQKFITSFNYEDTVSYITDEGVRFCIEVRDYLISTGIDLNNTYQNSDNVAVSTLSSAMSAFSPYLVKLCLDNGADPNLICRNQSYHSLENDMMYMLYNYRYMHNMKHINDVVEIFSSLINAGLNLHYHNSDNRNISDYALQNGWNDTLIGKLLRDHGAPEPTGNVYAGEWCKLRSRIRTRYIEDEDEDIYRNNEIVQLLQEYRFVKDQDKLATFYQLFKTLTIETLPLPHNGQDLYNHYIGRYGWRSTPINDHVKELLR